jgi:protein-disulfide isomerase
MRITRRTVTLGATVLLLIGGIGAAGTSQYWFNPVRSAAADAPTNDELLVSGPLGEEVQGRSNAPITIIEYSSMTCPHCANFDVNVYPILKSKYIDTGKVRYIMREFPLDPLAAAGFLLARCGGNDNYFSIIDELFRHQRDWVVEQPLVPLLKIAKQMGFTEQSFNACLANQKLIDGIEWVRKRAAEKFGVDSTPTFFINGKIYRGDMTAEEMETALNASPEG